MRSLSSRLPPLQAYVTAVIALGALCCAVVFVRDGSSLSRLLTPEVMLFAVCAFAGELISLKVVTRGAEGEVTTSTTFAFAALLVAGPACAVVALICASFAADLIQRKAPLKLLFNASQYVITLTASSLVLQALTGVPRVDEQFHFAPSDLPGILVAAAAFFLVNSSLVAVVIALVQDIRVGRYLVQDWFFQVSTGGLMLGLAPMVALAADFALPSVALLFLPLLAVHRGGRQAIAKEHQAVHDALTGLPNRSLFRHQIEQVVNAGRRADRTAAVMLIDLDHFKEINDTLGHHAGDRLLQEVSQRLRASAVEELIQRADFAMYAAKEGGRGYLLFEPQLDRYSPRRLSLAGALRSAIADGEIVLYFQPKAELTTGKIVGVEALARWQHPRLGLIGPSEFVPIAEQTGLIGPLTSHVLEEALRQVREWHDNGEELSVAVNLSA